MLSCKLARSDSALLRLAIKSLKRLTDIVTRDGMVTTVLIDDAYKRTKRVQIVLNRRNDNLPAGS